MPEEMNRKEEKKENIEKKRKNLKINLIIMKSKNFYMKKYNL